MSNNTGIMGATVSVNSELDIDQARREMGKRFTPEVEDRFYEIMDENGRVTMEDFKRVFPNMYKQMAEEYESHMNVIVRERGFSF